MEGWVQQQEDCFRNVLAINNHACQNLDCASLYRAKKNVYTKKMSKISIKKNAFRDT